MTTDQPPSPFHVWILAARPKTLWAGVAPILMGTAMAISDGGFHVWSALAALAGALLIQIGTNFCNDLSDFKKGADTEAREGPLRVTQAGLVTPEKMLRATVLVFSAAFFICLYLVSRGGWPFFLLLIISILSGVLYTAGPYPLGYIGLGDIFVFIFFGPIAVAGTYYAQTLEWSGVVAFAGVAPGLLSTAILAVNNLRDMSEDRQTGKHTLAVRFGPGFTRLEYVLCILGAAGVSVALVSWSDLGGWLLLSLVFLPLSIAPVRTVYTAASGELLNPTLATTAKLLLIYSVFFSIGCLL